MIYYFRIGYSKHGLKIKYIDSKLAYGYPRFNGIEQLGRWTVNTGWQLVE